MKKFKLSNKDIELCVLNYGGTWQSLKVAGKDILLGFDNLEDYKTKSPYFGSTVGRFANRIKCGQFTLCGKTYTLAKNNGNNNLHGGNVGFDKVVWNAEIITENGQEKLRLKYLSPDGEEGFPANLNVTVDYYITQKNEVVMEEFAYSDGDTLCNLTQHAYFNLNGHNAGTIYDHKIQILADKNIDVDNELIPTGKINNVSGLLDLRKPTQINNFKDNALVEKTNGYDFCYVCNGKGYRQIATASVKNLEMQVFTTKSAVQFYSGNFLNNLCGKENAVYNLHNGFCLESSGYPDSINHANFESSILKKGEIYRHKTAYKFIIK